MSNKVRQGLTFLTVAFAAVITAVVIGWIQSDPGPDNGGLTALHWATLILAAWSALTGSVLIALGLLRD